MHGRLLLAVTLCCLGTGMLAAPRPAPRVHVGRQPDGRIVVPTNQVLDPAGYQVEFPGRPTDVAVSPDGNLLAVLNRNSLMLVRFSDRIILQTLLVPRGGHTFTGLVWAPDGKTIYTSGTEGRVQRALLTGTVAAWGEPISPPGAGKDPTNPLPGGLALSPDGRTLYACLNRRNSLAIFDAASGTLQAEIPVGVAPYGVVVSGTTAYVSNWGGHQPGPGDMTANSGGTQTVIDPATGIASTGTVSVVDLAQGKVTAEIAVGLHPCGMALDAQGGRLFVANANSDTVSVINIATNQVTATIPVSPAGALPFGSAPNALAFRDGTLYVANGGNNALAVIPVGDGAAASPAGFIPTAWYPGGLALSRDGRFLLVANVKGVGSLNPPTVRGAHNSHDHMGSLSLIPVPDEATLAGYTRRVAENNRLGLSLANLKPASGLGKVPVPLRAGQRSVFEHVIYIIKENRTYDQVLGDMKEGNGDPSLVQFGEQVTPNHHKLAREFVLFDNFYCSGVLSADGHQWTDEAIVTDYLEKSFGGFERSYPYDGGDPLAYASSGFIWDNVLRHGLTFRNYGEFVGADIEPANATWSDLYADYKSGARRARIRAVPQLHTLEPYVCPTYIGFPGKVTDAYRADEFLREFRAYEAKGTLPNFIIMLLPNDHTVGTRPDYPTPQAAVADNDLALGRIVEAVSHSKFWPKTCIFVVEDDPQAGLDHVDGHRTVAFAISPYTRRHAVDSTNYNQTGMVRTIELILELPPMNQFDLSATPLAGCFTDKPDFRPYDAVPNRIPLDQLNPPLSALSGAQREWALKSLELPLDDIDQADEDTFNRILWHATKGYDTPYPRLARR